MSEPQKHQVVIKSEISDIQKIKIKFCLTHG